MKIFYGDSAGWIDASADSPIEASADTALAVFGGLDPRCGFMGIILDPRFTVQFAPQTQGGIRVELLDTSGPSFDACVSDVAFAEILIRAAADGRDVFQLARASTHEWEHTDL